MKKENSYETIPLVSIEEFKIAVKMILTKASGNPAEKWRPCKPQT